ncbi:MAG: flagellar hook-associated protein FlgK [Pseudomonadota bacterium]
MSLSGALASAVSGLAANTRQLQVTSGNIANALTPGYAARDVTLTTAAAGGGVRVVSTDRAADPAITALRREADADAAAAGTLAEGQARLATAFGELGDNTGLIPAAARMTEALRDLADTPASGPRQDAAARAAADLATSFNTTAEAANTLRSDTDAEIARLVSTVNAATSEIAALNAEIRRAQATTGDTTALEDRRETLIDQVNGALPVTVFPEAGGTVSLRTREGALLVGNQARPLTFTPTPIVTPGQAYANGTGALSGISLGGVDITPGGAGSQQPTSGALAGLFTLRDTEIPAFIANLDGAAEDLISRFEGVTDPTLAPTDAALFSDAGARLTPPPDPGLAGRLTVNPAIDPSTGVPSRLRDGLGATVEGPAGNDSFLRALTDALDTRTTAASTPAAAGNLDFATRLSALSEAASTKRVEAETLRSTTDATRNTLADAEGTTIGVDQDRELENLIRIEQAYAANAQVIRTASAMLDELTSIR